MLRNHRGIFLTQIIAKLYEKIMISRKKEALDSVSKLQSGSRSKRGSLDNLFLLQSCVDHAKHMNLPLYVTVYDFAQCFDALWLEDCIVSMWNIGVRDETLSTLYNMNKKATIKVKTPVGISEEFVCENIVKQGTVSGPPLCSISTAEYVTHNSVRGFPIGEYCISSMILVDDVANTNTAPDDVIKSHENMGDFSNLKRLPLNGKKCFVLPVNVKNSHHIPSLQHEGVRLEVVDEVVYLGNVFNTKGNNRSNVLDRICKARTCMIESLSLCSEITLGIYILQSLVLTHNMMFIPTLLYGAQTWTNLTGEDIKQLETTQLQFLKRIMKVSPSTCNTITYLELGVLPVSFEIHIMKLMFLYHILELEDDDPVKRTYHEQATIPGEKNWASEVNELRAMYYIEEQDEEIKAIPKDQWKAKVHCKVKVNAISQLNQGKNQLSKSSTYPDAEEFKTAEYISQLTVSVVQSPFKDYRCKRPSSV